jgi:hypothetical protein
MIAAAITAVRPSPFRRWYEIEYGHEQVVLVGRSTARQLAREAKLPLPRRPRKRK